MAGDLLRPFRRQGRDPAPLVADPGPEARSRATAMEQDLNPARHIKGGDAVLDDGE
jgi:hypothetical protein